MRQPHVPPRDIPREFRVSEAFFSCTDERGIILSGNRVFSRISGYSQAELIGKPHNIIRHPDIPRAVFKLLWDTLHAGEPICAYVKNMAKDGCYYWVLALVAPVPGGYISVRFKPSGPLLGLVESVYKEMRAIEIATEERGGSGDQAMAAATEYLLEALRSKGFADYSAFMRQALLRTELASRDAEIAQAGLQLFAEPPAPATAPLAMELRRACENGRGQYGEFRRHFAELEELSRLDDELRGTSASILEQAADIGTVAFNVAFRASKLGHQGQSVAVIASYLNRSSREIGERVRAIADNVARVSDRLSRAVFDLAWLRLQYEMAVIYEHEVAGEVGANGNGLTHEELSLRWRMLAWLRAAFERTGERALAELEELSHVSSGITDGSDELDRIVMALRVARVSGLVESSRLGSDVFKTIFEQVDAQIERTMKELKKLSRTSGRLGTLSTEAARVREHIRHASAQLAADAEVFGARTAAAAHASGDEGWMAVDDAPQAKAA